MLKTSFAMPNRPVKSSENGAVSSALRRTSGVSGSASITKRVTPAAVVIALTILMPKSSFPREPPLDVGSVPPASSQTFAVS